MLGEVVRHAANGIYRIGPQVTYSISIKIHRIGAIAGRNELRISHGASIRALQATGIHFLLPGDFKESGQLTTEECPPYRMMKRQRSQRIQYTVTSGKASITGFDADNGGNHFRWDVILLFGTGKGFGMLLDELNATDNPFRLKKNLAILIPAQVALHRPGHGIQYILLEHSGVKCRLEPVTLNTACRELTRQLTGSTMLVKGEIRCQQRRHCTTQNHRRQRGSPFSLHLSQLLIGAWRTTARMLARQQSSMSMNRHENTESSHQGHAGGPAVAHQGQRYTDHRQDAADHPHIDKKIDKESQYDAAAQQATKRLVGGGCQAQPTQHD